MNTLQSAKSHSVETDVCEEDIYRYVLYQLWHDRAVLHFLTTHEDQQRYLATLTAATEPGTMAVFATFAPDGPQQCSGLPVARYAPEDLANLLGSAWTPTWHDHEIHTTPAGSTQSFTWATFQRKDGPEDPNNHQ